MSLTFEIAPPSAEADAIAEGTRSKLMKLVQDAADTADAVVTELSKADIRAARQEGAAAFEQLRAVLSVPGGDAGTDLVHALTRSIRKMGDTRVEDYRTLSYQFEGIVKAYNAAVHQAGLKVDDRLKATLGIALFCEYHDSAAYSWLEMQGLPGGGLGVPFYPFQELCDEHKLSEYVHYSWGNSGKADTAARAAVNASVFNEVYVETWRGMMQVQLSHCRPLMLPYTDVDGPWVAGFASAEDSMRGRFTRCPLGSWLASRGAGDGRVKLDVERIKAVGSTGHFVVYPNDIAFGNLYEKGGRGRVSSCMAAPREDYCTVDGLHPTDMYSSSYFGRGDNGLALVMQYQGSEVAGRGILNTETMQVVRWYGNVQGKRALLRAGVRTDYNALEGSWLVHYPFQNNSTRVVAPYVDGDYQGAWVDDKAGRMYLTSGGDCLCETDGYFDLDQVYCQYNGHNVPRDDATYQSEHNNFIADDICDDWRCALIQEWCDEDDRYTLYLDGYQVEVCRRVAVDRIDQYLTKIDSTQEMLDDGVEDQNYTGRGQWATIPQRATPAPGFRSFNWAEPAAMAAAPVLAADFSELKARSVAAMDEAVATGTGRILSPAAQYGCPCPLCRIERGEGL